MRKILAYPFMAAMVLALPACMTDSALNDAPGHYENSTHSVDASGTARDSTKTTDVWYDQYGNKHAVTEKSASTDPKGLFNKKTSTATENEVEPAAK